jgi:hypothetical protein
VSPSSSQPRRIATSWPDPSAPVTHSPAIPSQDAIFLGLGEWVAANHALTLTPETYVLSNLEDSNDWVTSLDREPELEGAGRPVWSDEMTGASSEALAAALSPVAGLQPVDDPLSVVDSEGFRSPGVSALLGRPDNATGRRTDSPARQVRGLRKRR